jgi:hypothetical protein
MKINLKGGGEMNTKRPTHAYGHERSMEMRTATAAASNNTTQPETAVRRDNSGVPKIIDWIIVGAIYLLTFLVPLFFLPIVPSILELNKQMLLVLLGGVAFLAWIGKLAWEGKIRIKKNFFLIPILFLLFILALNTGLSVYRDQSMWGSFGTESLSLVTIIALVAIFLVVTNNFFSRQKIKILALIIIGSSAVANIFALFQIFGKFIFKNPALAQNSFNSIGSVYALSIYFGAILLLTVSMLLEKQSLPIKISLMVCSLLFIFTLIMINFITALVIFLVGMAVLLGLAIITSSNEEKNRGSRLR